MEGKEDDGETAAERGIDNGPALRRSAGKVAAKTGSVMAGIGDCVAGLTGKESGRVGEGTGRATVVGK